MRHIIFINGPVGVGKTTLGRGLAERLNGTFIDSDDLSDPSKTWLKEVLSGSKRLVQACIAALTDNPLVIVAKPLRNRDWIFFQAMLQIEDTSVFCITLAASCENILAHKRGRVFDTDEQDRIEEMLVQGYAERSFSDLIIRTDQLSFEDTLKNLEMACHSLLAR